MLQGTYPFSMLGATKIASPSQSVVFRRLGKMGFLCAWFGALLGRRIRNSVELGQLSFGGFFGKAEETGDHVVFIRVQFKTIQS